MATVATTVNRHATTDSGPPTATATRTLRLGDLVLFTVSAVVVADTVAASAAIGVLGLTFWGALAVLFLLPYALVTAELGAAWPSEGGIYAWVREAFGPFWSSMTSWLYWVSVAFWMPSAFVLFTGTMTSVFAPDMPRVWETVVVIGLIWVTIGIGVIDLRWGKWAANITALLKIGVLGSLGVIGVAYALANGPANSFSASEWVPSWQSSYTFLPVIVFSFMGFELVSSAGSDIRDPQRNVPRAIAVSAGVILLVYVFATFGILAAVPAEDVSIVTGIADALAVSFAGVFGDAGIAYDLLIIALLATFLGTAVSWSIGSSRVIAATGRDRVAPRIFAHRHPRFDTPDHALILMGAIATGLTIVNYALFATRDGIFWTIFSVSAIVFLLPYLVLFPAAAALRRTRPDRPRPFVIPGGRAGMWISVALGEVFILCTIFLFITQVPEGTSAATYWAVTIGGTVATVAAGWSVCGRRQAASIDRTGAEVGGHARVSPHEAGPARRDGSQRPAVRPPSSPTLRPRPSLQSRPAYTASTDEPVRSGLRPAILLFAVVAVGLLWFGRSRAS